MKSTPVLLSITLLALCIPCVAIDQYWISFGSYGSGISGAEISATGPAIYVMKIDQYGNILIPPVKVVRNSRDYQSPQSPGTALFFNGRNFLNLWIPARFPKDGAYPLFRVIIAKRSMETILMNKTPLGTYTPSFINVTQKGQNDFLALQRLDATNSLFKHEAFGITAEGALAGRRWQILRASADCDACGSAISADGGAYVFTDYIHGVMQDSQQVLYQHLTTDSKPSGKVKAVSARARVDAIDVSNISVGGRRFVLYSQNQGQVYDALYLQPVQSNTGETIGKRILVGRQTGFRRDAVIDPAGRFVVYMDTGSLLGIVYQALDASGRPVGKNKILVEAGGGGLDILKE